MWICPNCEVKNEDGETYCACCGEKRIQAPPPKPEPKPAPKPEPPKTEPWTSPPPVTPPKPPVEPAPQPKSSVQPTQTKTEKSAAEQEESRLIGRIATVVIVAAFYLLLNHVDSDISGNPVLHWAPLVAVPLAFWGKTLLLRIPASIAVGFALMCDIVGVLSLLLKDVSGIPDFLLVIGCFIIFAVAIYGGSLAYAAGEVPEEEKKSQ